MSKETVKKTEQRKEVMEKQRSQWKAVIHGESAQNIAKFRRQIDKYGRIKTWW